MRLLLVDDEAPARRRLRRMLDEIGGVEVAGEASDGIEALAQIEALRPDLLLLDVRMPRLDGVALALEHEGLPPVIFITAHDEYAVAAFEAHAVDYLLKPVRRARLQRAIGRARQRCAAAAANTASSVLSALQLAPLRVSARSRASTRLFDVASIARFYAADKLTAFRSDGEEHLLDDSLSTLELRLARHRFLRVHRAELINLDRVQALHNEHGVCEVELDNGQRARVSRRSVARLRQALGLVAR